MGWNLQFILKGNKSDVPQPITHCFFLNWQSFSLVYQEHQLVWCTNQILPSSWETIFHLLLSYHVKQWSLTIGQVGWDQVHAFCQWKHKTLQWESVLLTYYRLWLQNGGSVWKLTSWSFIWGWIWICGLMEGFLVKALFAFGNMF